jgi:putative ABC transport system permease protein
LSGFFGALAIVLAGIGLYGVTSYAVGRRTRELAMRIALGANANHVVRLVLRNVAIMVALGAAIGMALTWWATKFVTTMLFGVQARDPLTLLTALGALTIVALIAGGLPARRAAKLDPSEVLRQ